MGLTDDRRGQNEDDQCAQNQVKAYHLLGQIRVLGDDMILLRTQFDALATRMDDFEQISVIVTELNKDFGEFKDHIEETIIKPFVKISDVWDKIKSRAPYIIIFMLLTGADWDNLPKIASFFTNIMKLVGV